MSLVRNRCCTLPKHILNHSLQNPSAEEFVPIPGLSLAARPASDPVDISDYGCHDTNLEIQDVSQASGPSNQPSSPLLGVINHAPGDIDGLATGEASYMPESSQEPEYLSGVAIAEQYANDEWQRQNMLVHNYEAIHHFNYLGEGTPCKNATPPAVSLFVIITGAKTGLADADGPYDLHDDAVMRNAMRCVDPVIYYGSPENLYLRGENLREAVTGNCEKFYSEHGTWRNDRYGQEEDCPALDRMDVHDYPFSSLPVNGWYQDRIIIDRWTFQTKSLNIAKWHNDARQNAVKQRRGCERKGSPLRHVTTIEDPEPASEDTAATPGTVTTLKNAVSSGKAATKWTVDLDEFFGKCSNWADEIESEDEDDVPVGNSSAGSSNNSPTPSVQSDAIDEGESDTEVSMESSSASISDLVPFSKPSAESTSSDEESLVAKGGEMNELPANQSIVQHCALNDPRIPSDPTTNGKLLPLDGLTEEELQAEDEELYGASPTPSEAPSEASSEEPSETVSRLLQQLRESGLIPASDGATSLCQSSEKDDDVKMPSVAMNLEPLTLGGNFSLPIREKPAALVNGSPTLSTTVLDVSPVVLSSPSFYLPIRVKASGTFVCSKNDGNSLSFTGIGSIGEIAPVLEDTISIAKSAPSPSPLTENELSEVDGLDGTDTNEQLSTTPAENLNCIVLPLRPRKTHAHRLTDSPSNLLETASAARSKADNSAGVEQSLSKRATETPSTFRVLPKESLESVIVSPKKMMEKFKNASEIPSKKRSGIPRSKSFSDLKSIADKGAPFQSGKRHLSLPSRKELEQLAQVPLLRPRPLFKMDKLDAIFEEDELEAFTEEIGESSETSAEIFAHVHENRTMAEDLTDVGESNQAHEETDVDTLPELPVRSPYRLLASNTPGRMMGRCIRFDLSDELPSDGSSDNAELVDDFNSSSAGAKDTGEPFIYALDNWSAIFGHDDKADVAHHPPANLGGVPFLGFSPHTASSTATVSEESSGSKSSDISSKETGAASATVATPPIDPPKIVKDVNFIRTRAPKSTWGKVKEKLSINPSVPKLQTTKMKLGKSAKKFLRKSLEVFAGMGHPPF